MNSRCFKYLGLSIVANMLIVSMVKIESAKAIIEASPLTVLKISLNASASPAPKKTPQVQKVRSPKIVQKIAPSEKFLDTVSVETPQEEQKAEQKTKGEPVKEDSHEKLNHGNGKDDSTIIYPANYRHQIPPVYPQRAMELGQEGSVTLYVEVMPTGFARGLRIVQSSGYRLLDMAAMTAVKKWEFEPTSINGNSIVSWVEVPVRFVIKNN